MNKNIYIKHMYIYSEIIFIILISTIYVVSLVTISPIIDHIFSPLDKKVSNVKILGEIIIQMVILGIALHYFHKLIIWNIINFINIKELKTFDIVIGFVISVCLIGLQSNLHNKLIYITYEHPFRLF